MSITARGLPRVSPVSYIYGDYQTGIIWGLRYAANAIPGSVSWRGRRFTSWLLVRRTTASSTLSTTTARTRSID